MKTIKNRPMLELRLLLGFATVTSVKKIFNCA